MTSDVQLSYSAKPIRWRDGAGVALTVLKACLRPAVWVLRAMEMSNRQEAERLIKQYSYLQHSDLAVWLEQKRKWCGDDHGTS